MSCVVCVFQSAYRSEIRDVAALTPAQQAERAGDNFAAGLGAARRFIIVSGDLEEVTEATCDRHMGTILRGGI